MRARRRGVADKKLIAVARQLACPARRGGGDVSEDDPDADKLRAFLEARRRAVGGAAPPQDIEVPPDEADAVQLFITLQTQWQWHPVAAMRTGLNYASIGAAAAMLGLVMTPALFLDIRVMEGAALSAFAKDRT